MNISALVPAYNEEDKIENTIKSIKKSKYINYIVVIDDGSKDNTAEIAIKLDVEVIRLETNRGKGFALECGIRKVINKSDIIVFLDADLEESSIEVDRLIEPILKNQCDVTIAKINSTCNKGGFGLVKLLAKKGVKYFTKYDFDCSLSGQRAFKTEVLKEIKKIPRKYGVEIGMIIDILNSDYTIKEIEVDMKHRETGRDLRGFIHRGKQFFQILETLIWKSLE